MVVSNLVRSVSYPELKSKFPDDHDMDMDVFQLEINGMEVMVNIGKPKNTFVEQGITYFPIYLIKHDDTLVQIGVYEISTTLTNEITEDIMANNDPLLYTFATTSQIEAWRKVPVLDNPPPKSSSFSSSSTSSSKSLSSTPKSFKKSSKKSSKSKSSNNAFSSIPFIRKDLFQMSSNATAVTSWKEETSKKAKHYRDKYHETKEDNWVQKLMKNPFYTIEDNEGGGDCFFATIRDAFRTVGQTTTVAQLRAKVADQLRPEDYRDYQERYDMFLKEINETRAKSIELKKEYDQYKERMTAVMNREQQLIIYNQAQALKRQFDRLKEENAFAKENIADVVFMKHLKSMEDLKRMVRTPEFWADARTLNQVEQMLNVKLILLSSKHYRQGDMNGVLLCGTDVDPAIVSRGEFRPEAYIMMEYTGNHYKLVKYKKRGVFTFAELPYDIRRMIADKCMERNSGVFSYIPEFQAFHGISGGSSSSSYSLEELGEAKIMNLYDDHVVFQCYNNSAENFPPGKGMGEKVPVSMLSSFSRLAKIPNWRKKLSNQWVQPFAADNHRWASVEHYYQASKFKKNNPDFMLSFTLDSGTELSKNPAMAKGAGGKTGEYQGERIRPKTVTIDPDFFESRMKKETRLAQEAKFTQNQDLKELLLETKNAKITFHRRGQPDEVQDGLMMLRRKLTLDIEPK